MGEKKIQDIFTFKDKIIDLKEYYDISIRVYKREQEIGFIKCCYWKKDGCLFIEDMDTNSQFRRKGLGLLRVYKLLDILGKNGLELSTVVAEEVGAYSRTPELRRGIESFLGCLGFQKDGKSNNWYAEGNTLKNRLDGKLK